MRTSASVIALLLSTPQEPYSAEIQQGAQLVMDFQGTKNGGKPYVWLRGTRYSSVDKIPGWTFSRASTGYAEGLVDDVVTNKVTCWNANPTSLQNMEDLTTGRASVVNDSAALTAAGLSGVATLGNVYKIDNAGNAGSAQLNPVGAVGNTNPHTISVWARGTGDFMVRDDQGGQIFTLTPTYQRYVITKTPASAGPKMRIQAQPGTVVYFILPQLIERSTAIPQDIVTAGSAASAVVGQVQGLKLFGAGEPRITEKGLLIEEARTNSNRTTNTATAVLGTIGAGGSLPTYWGVASTAGVSYTVTDKGTENGIPYVEVRMAGTNTSGGIGVVGINFEASTTIVAAQGQTWTGSAYIRQTAGALPPLGVPRVYVYEWTSVGGFLTNSSDIVPLTSTWSRTSHTRALANASTARTTVGFGVAVQNGDSIDLTLRFGLPQMELGGFVTSPIATSGAAATRAGDHAYIMGLGAILGQFRTNLAQWSTDTSNAQWAATQSAKTTGFPDPLGGLGAVKVTANGSGNSHNFAASANTVPYASGQIYTMSRMVKADTQSLLQLTGNNAVFQTNGYANFDLSTGTVTAQVGLTSPATIVPLGDGWYRISISALSSGTGTLHAGAVVFISSPTSLRAESNTLATSYYDFGAQVEVGSTVSDFIITQGAPASAGNPSTLSAWADLPAVDNVRRTLAVANDGSSANRLMALRESDNSAFGYSVSPNQQGGVSVSGKSGARILKLAVRLRAIDLRVVADGTLSNVGAVQAAPLNLSRIDVGSLLGGAHLNGYVQRVGVYGDTAGEIFQGLTQ